jgi:PAS domain S-box-containing protein
LRKSEEQLRSAKEELHRYSRDLERQVGERTREITGILRNTPSVVYIKDKGGCYRLVNSRYEELFGIRNEEIQGKSDHDIFPKEIADQFRENDLRVFAEGRPCQVEERVPHEDDRYLPRAAAQEAEFEKQCGADAVRDSERDCGIVVPPAPVRKKHSDLRIKICPIFRFPPLQVSVIIKLYK